MVVKVDDELKVPASMDRLPVILDWVHARASAAGLREEAVRHLQLACEEIVVNVIHHAYRDAGGDILLRLGRPPGGEGVVVEICDWGPPCDILEIPEPDLDQAVEDRPIGGLGVYLARRVTDALEWSRDGERNRVRITKRNDP